MSVQKEKIRQALEQLTPPGGGQNLVESGALQNILIFENQVDIDLQLANPSLQARKKMEAEVVRCITEHVDADL